MNDLSDFVNQRMAAGPQLAQANIDENPDDGARALQLSQATGVAPLAIHADLDGFEQQHKSLLVSQMV